MIDPIEKGYLGNVNLKRKNVSVNWDKKKLKEFVKCAKDPIYFSEQYINIVHVDHGLIPIELYEYQKEIIKKITDNRRVSVVTSRQAGKPQLRWQLSYITFYLMDIKQLVCWQT